MYIACRLPNITPSRDCEGLWSDSSKRRWRAYFKQSYSKYNSGIHLEMQKSSFTSTPKLCANWTWNINFLL